MRSWLVAAGCAAAMVWGAPAARAESPWYISGSAGGVFVQDFADGTTFSKTIPILAPQLRQTMAGNNIVVVAHPPTFVTVPVTARGTQRLSYSPGAAAYLAIGYHVSSHIRLEGEVGYAHFSVSTLRPSSASTYFTRLNGQTFEHQSGAAVDRISWTLNAFYDFPTLASRFSPYLGLGLGGLENHRTTGRFVDAVGTTFTSNGGWVVGTEALLEAGVGIRVARRWMVSPAYRYDHLLPSGQDAHLVKVGARYLF